MPKKRLLGCSFPVFIGVAVVFLLMFLIGFAAGPLGKSLFGLNLPAWISVPQPSPELPAEVVFHILGFPVTNSLIGAWITIIFLVTFCFLVTRKITLVPGRRQALLEIALESLLGFCQRVAGEKNGRRFFPVIATIFFYVVFNAWLSLLPGYGSIFVRTAEGEVHLLRGANTDINTTLSIALIAFVFIEVTGLRALGIRYLGKFINLVGVVNVGRLLMKGQFKAALSGLLMGVINIFVGILELVSELIRIVSFTFRLFGNMTAGEILLLVVVFLVPWVLAVPFYVLELLVGFVQALIFAGLTLIFLTMAVISHSHQEESSHH